MNASQQRLVTWVAIPVLTIGIFMMDLYTPRGLSDWVWYFIPLLLSSYVSNRLLPFLLTSIFSVLTLAGYFVPVTAGTTAYLSLTSRVMGICVLWLVAWLISQRQRTEERVQEQAELLDLAHDAILVKDLEDRVLYWNKSAECLYGWTAPEVLGRKSSELLQKTGFTFDEASRILLATGIWSGELTCQTKSGREVVVEARWTLVRNRKGEPKAILSINTDITDKKKLQEQLLRSQRMQSLGTLAGGIAHDLNNILTPLMMSVAMLKDKANDADSKLLLATLEENVHRGAGLVQQVLAFARGVGGERIAVNLVQVVHEIERIVRETFPKSVHFESSLSPDLWTLIGDSTQLHQVLLNLCLNARDAMPNGGKISVQMENVMLDDIYVSAHLDAKRGAYLVIKVTDTGVGISPQLQDKIFEPFFTTKDLGKGTGLGLSSVLAIVKSHGGFISFYSEVGKGSIFKIYLPASAGPSDTEIARANQNKLPRGRNEVVLLVDDEEAIRNTAKKLLERFGYRVLLAENGAEAVSLYAQRRNEIALVLTDMAMPIMDGVATIVALKSINPGVKIISSSGLAANGSVAKASGAGVKHFIPKPYTAEAMLQTVHKILHEN
jgi:PAS domain S-box-containing protein